MRMREEKDASIIAVSTSFALSTRRLLEDRDRVDTTLANSRVAAPLPPSQRNSRLWPGWRKNDSSSIPTLLNCAVSVAVMSTRKRTAERKAPTGPKQIPAIENMDRGFSSRVVLVFVGVVDGGVGGVVVVVVVGVDCITPDDGCCCFSWALIRKIVLARLRAQPNRYVQTAMRPTADGSAPGGAVAEGRARNPCGMLCGVV